MHEATKTRHEVKTRSGNGQDHAGHANGKPGATIQNEETQVAPHSQGNDSGPGDPTADLSAQVPTTTPSGEPGELAHSAHLAEVPTTAANRDPGERTHSARMVGGRRPRTQLDPDEVLRSLKPYLVDIPEPAAMTVRDLELFYGTTQALHKISLKIPAKKVTAFIGPSGCGKSTLLRSLNRMNDLIDDVRITGSIELEGKNIYDRNVDVNMLRRRVGMVFQKSNPFPKSIFENVAYGQRIAGGLSNDEIRRTVEDSLQRVGLWSEVSSRLEASALDLSGGQQQRLCIARAIAISPEIILMDEPCSALDPIATAKVEELIEELKKDYTIVIVTHNMQQAARVSDYTAFMWLGRIVEYARTDQLFTNPAQSLTEDYITGRFG